MDVLTNQVETLYIRSEIDTPDAANCVAHMISILPFIQYRFIVFFQFHITDATSTHGANKTVTLSASLIAHTVLNKRSTEPTFRISPYENIYHSCAMNSPQPEDSSWEFPYDISWYFHVIFVWTWSKWKFRSALKNGSKLGSRHTDCGYWNCKVLLRLFADESEQPICAIRGGRYTQRCGNNSKTFVISGLLRQSIIVMRASTRKGISTL